MIESTLYRNITESPDNKDPIAQVEVDGVKYMIHRTKKIFMKETKMMQILGKFAIPVYKNTMVHFKDICKQIIKNIFEAKNMEVQFNHKIEKRIKSKWNKRYKSLKKQRDASIESADQFMAGKLILRWVKRAKMNLKLKKLKEEGNYISQMKSDKRRSLMPLKRKGSKSAFKLGKKMYKALSEYDNILFQKPESTNIPKPSSIMHRHLDPSKSNDSSKAILKPRGSRDSKDFQESYNRVKDYFSQEENKFDTRVFPLKSNSRIKSHIAKYPHTKILPFNSPKKTKLNKHFEATPQIEEEWLKPFDGSVDSLKFIVFKLKPPGRRQTQDHKKKE